MPDLQRYHYSRPAAGQPVPSGPPLTLTVEADGTLTGRDGQVRQLDADHRDEVLDRLGLALADALDERTVAGGGVPPGTRFATVVASRADGDVTVSLPVTGTPVGGAGELFLLLDSLLEQVERGAGADWPFGSGTLPDCLAPAGT